MEKGKSIVQWKPYTVIITKDDQVYIYDRTWEEANDAVMEFGCIALSRYKMTIDRYQIKRMYEVNTEKHTSVDNWIYSLPTERCRKMLNEHEERKKKNGIGITSIEQGMRILEDMKHGKIYRQEEIASPKPERVREIMRPVMEKIRA